MSIQVILSIAMVVYVLIAGFLTAFRARKFHWSVALMRTGIVILSAVVAVPIAQAVAAPISNLLSPLMEGLMSGDIGDLMTHAPILAQSVQQMMILIAVPAVFLVAFWVVWGLLTFALWIVGKFVPFIKSKGLKNTAIAVPVGAVNGILLALVTLIPLCGYITITNVAMDAIGMGTKKQDATQSTASAKPTYDVLADTTTDAAGQLNNIKDKIQGLSDMSGNAIVNVVNTLGSPLFNWMTTANVEGSSGTVAFSLTQDLPQLTSSLTQVGDAVELIKDKEMTAEDKQALLDAVDGLLASDWVAEVMAQSVGFIAGKWQAGESFMGVEAPYMGEVMAPVMDKAWEILSNENSQTLREDLKTVTNVLADLMSLGFLGDGVNKEQLMSQLGKDSVLSHIMQTLSENPHMASLADELRTVGVRLASSVMGEELINSDKYDGVMSDMAGALTGVLDMSAEERRETVQTSVKQAFAEKNIDVPEDVALEMSEKAIAELGNDGEITGEELKQFFIDHMDEGLGAVGDLDNIEIPDLT